MTQPLPMLEPAVLAERLAALEGYGVLDTPAEQGFDDIVLLATQLCQAPVALVSLIETDRQWFKARVGFPHCQTDLNSSVCVHAMAEPRQLIIPDLTSDPRTAANPLVTGDPHIRFYAGVPLRTSSGLALGSLCVIDRKPRPQGLTPAQIDGLQALARQVMTQLELRRTINRRDALLAQHRSDLHARDVLRQTQAAITAAGGRLEDILEAVVAGAMHAIPAAEAGVVELIDGDALEYRAVRGSLLPHKGLRVSLYDSLAGCCALSGEPMLVTDVSRHPLFKSTLMEKLGVRSAMFAPVTRAGQVLGVLKLQSSKLAAFEECDLQQVELFAGVATAGLTEAREFAARQAVEASETRYRAIFESAIDYAIIVMDLDGCVTNWNTGAENILGWSFAEMRGKPADVFFTPEDRDDDIAAKEMHSALTVGRGIDERWHLRKSGERFWANGEMMALRNEADQAIGFVKILRDRTAQRLSEERLRASDERLQMALIASGVVGLWDWMVDTDLLHGDANFARLYGLDIDKTTAGLTMEQYQEHVVPDDLAGLRADIRETFERGADFRVEYRLAIPGQPLRWVECKGQLIHGEDGKPVRFSGTAVDITVRKTAEREARRLAVIVEQSGDFIGVANLDGTVAWVNEAGRHLVGLTDAASARQTTIQDYFDPAQWPEIVATVFPAVDATGQWRGELRFRHFVTGAFIPVIYDVIALRDTTGATTAYATVTRDITLQKQAEAQQDILNRELSHRMKNILAMVQAIATQTLRNAPDPVVARDALAARLIALGKAHDILMSGQGESAAMQQIITEALKLHDDGTQGRFRIEGPPVICGSKAGLSLALMIHELATNAAKYGALSKPDGRVGVRWDLSGPAGGETLTFHWQEQGGPSVVPPTRKGFGSRLIERGLAGSVGGEVTMRYPAEGVTCTLTAPLAGFVNEI